MAENFEVNYSINVFSDQATKAIEQFTAATSKLTEAAAPFRKLNTSVSNLNDKLVKLNAKTFSVKIEVGKAERNVDRLIGKLRQLETIAKKTGLNLGSIAAGQGAAIAGNNNKNSSSGTNSNNKTTTTTTSTRQSKNSSGGSGTKTSNSKIARNLPNNLGYKLLGPTQLDVGGIMAIDMLKGMGIAYGIAGLGNLISNSVKDYTEYNNIMQTAKNILGSHDKRNDFASRFSAMEQQVRNVGVETKFTAPQVADAAKFLSMAGFDVDAINKSIKPIADIALVGDTDLGETADVVTNIMTGYNIAPEKVRNAADIMTMTFTKSNTTLMEIAEAYKYSASLLAAGNMPFEEATAAMGILGNAGIKGSQAGTTMRTIMANIVNPTKKQQAAWKRIGVSRTDKNGNMRDVVDIFEDLNKKDLSLSDYYQIFHKTAAQGAVSLADNVENWNDIIKANFMSEGLAKELADEKKNTIQGLWAQLTSMFTEDGIEAFEEIQQPIKNFLTQITDWLKTSEAKNFIKQTAKDLMDFAKMIYDVTKKMLGFYETFRPLIKTFVEFQMKMWPILTTLRIFRAGLLGFAGIVKVIGLIGALTGRMAALNTVIRANGLGSWLNGIAKSGFGTRTYFGDMLNQGFNNGAGLGNLTPIGNNKLFSERFGKEITIDTARRYASIYGPKNTISLGGLAPSLGGAVGGLSGGYVGNAFGGTNGAIIGGLLGAVAPAIGFMVSNPVGWITTAVVGIAGLSTAIYESIQAWNKATEAAEQYKNSIHTIGGVLVGENLTNTESYLNLVYNKELGINEIIKERLRLRNEEFGFPTTEAGKTPMAFDGSEFKKAYSAWIEKENFFRGAGSEAKDKINEMLGRTVVTNDQQGNYYWNGKKFNVFDGTIGASKNLAGYAAIYTEAYAGQASQKAKEGYYNQLSGILHNGSRSTWDDIAEIKKNFQSYYTPKNYDRNTLPQNFSYTLKDIYNPEKGFLLSNDKIVNMYPYQQGLYDSLNPIFGSNAPVWNVAKTYFDHLASNKLVEQDVVDYIRLMDLKMGDWLREYTSSNINAWLRAINFDPVKGTFVAGGGHTAEQNAQIAVARLSELVSILTSLGVPAEQAASAFSGLMKQMLTVANGFVWEGNPSNTLHNINHRNGDTVDVDGVKYKYEDPFGLGNGTWVPINNSVASVVSNKTMIGMLNRQRQNGNRPSSNNQIGTQRSITPGTHNSKVGASQADYKQHYNNKTAAPKQVIVKIENLMNVKSIDLSNKDNQEVIDNVKAQLTQALVDVVHDFDDTWHG